MSPFKGNPLPRSGARSRHYYKLMGWDSEMSRPLPETLRRIWVEHTINSDESIITPIYPIEGNIPEVKPKNAREPTINVETKMGTKRQLVAHTGFAENTLPKLNLNYG